MVDNEPCSASVTVYETMNPEPVLHPTSINELLFFCIKLLSVNCL